MMRKLVFPLLLILISFKSFSYPFPRPEDEGMWIPLLLKNLNIEDMQEKGLKLSAEDIYSINRSSLKDAVVSFGGFCTGEMISKKGLLLTNHHCGYGQIQSHSSVENDYLTHGFWAMSLEEELPNPNLTATFIVRIEDVTEQVLKGVSYDMEEQKRQEIVNTNKEALITKAVEGTHYNASIKTFFYGSEYYMFITETFKDVRLVGTPPSSIGKFGGDTDNWMWPRHTGDFSVFRVYADKNNQPAEYSKDNVPYKPKHFFPINIGGIEEGDFTMVMGFPGSTEEYLSSYAVDWIKNGSNPKKIALREKCLQIMDAGMKSSDKVRIQYASKYARVSNYHKKWIGENRGLKKLDAVEQKRKLEAQFTEWYEANENRKRKYGNILAELEKAYQQLKEVDLANDYLNEAVFRVDGFSNALNFYRFIGSSNSGVTQKQWEKLQEQVKAFYKDYNKEIDKKLFVVGMEAYFKDISENLHPEFFSVIEKEYKGNFEKYADKIYEESMLVSEEKSNAFFEKGLNGTNTLEQIQEDIMVKMLNEFINLYRSSIRVKRESAIDIINVQQRLYIEGLRAMMPDKKFYPDANSTLRIAYGKVDSYYPRDGVKYQYQTTLDGIMEKEDPDNEEFIVPDKLKELYLNKDYGKYEENGTVPVCFTASNHTTGGNSGSPIINCKGHLIGINFDRNWEGTMSDIMYDPDQVRNISVDIRYVLFIIDKFAGAKHLIKEMKIVRK